MTEPETYNDETPLKNPAAETFSYCTAYAIKDAGTNTSAEYTPESIEAVSDCTADADVKPDEDVVARDVEFMSNNSSDAPMVTTEH